MNQHFHIYSAPLQGYTDHVWRRSHALVFGGIDCYYSPFMRIQHGGIMSRDLRDVLPEHNQGMHFVPQILACAPPDAVTMASRLKALGYTEIDINMGCPFPPIARHAKGSGILCYADKVKALFEALAAIDGVRYSVKMRLGYAGDDEWRQVLPLMSIINPTHITVHPRTGLQQYKGEINMRQFDDLLHASPYPVVYNGELHSLDDVDEVRAAHPTLAGVMIGRALVANPALLEPEKADKAHYQAFHDKLYGQYQRLLASGGPAQLLSKMKAFWEMYLPNADAKSCKLIHKATTIEKYDQAVAQLFSRL